MFVLILNTSVSKKKILRKLQKNAANKMQRDVSIDHTTLQYTNNTRAINLREIYTVYFAA